MYQYSLNNRAINSQGGVPLTNVSDWQLSACRDFNGDGKADVLLRSQSTGRWYQYLMNNRAILSAGSVGMTQDTNWTVQP